jgi:hypothetical protein
MSLDIFFFAAAAAARLPAACLHGTIGLTYCPFSEVVVVVAALWISCAAPALQQVGCWGGMCNHDDGSLKRSAILAGLQLPNVKCYS